tara:strand:+ start:5964 stop:6368 length:405 start_codon:yes stop_codon:yes gene_type:complete
MKNRIFLKFLIINIVFISFSIGQYKKVGLDAVNRELNRYRIKILEEDLYVNRGPYGIIKVNINARRTNYLSLSLVTFYAVGKVYSGNEQNIKEIIVSINIENNKMIKRARYQDVQDLIMGRISQEEFFYKIKTS